MVNITQNVNVTVPNQRVIYQEIFYPDFVNSTINGTISNGNLTETTILNLTLRCSALDKTNKTLAISSSSNVKGEFNFNFSPLA